MDDYGTVLYSLPHMFTIEADRYGFSLWCNHKFVFAADTLEEVFIAYGSHLKNGR